MKQDIEADAARWDHLRKLAKAHFKKSKKDEWSVGIVEVDGENDTVTICGMPSAWGWLNHEARSLDHAMDLARKEAP